MRVPPRAEFEEAWIEREAASKHITELWIKIRVLLEKIQAQGGIATTQLRWDPEISEIRMGDSDTRLKFEVMPGKDGKLTFAMGVQRHAESTLEDLGDRLFRLEQELMRLSGKQFAADKKLREVCGL